MGRRLTVNLKKTVVMQVRRVNLGNKKLVYVLVVPKLLKYKWGRSKIAYVGTTKKGMDRIAQSVAARADHVLSCHGIRKFEVRIVVCAPRPNVKTWIKLERAILLAFRHRFGELPICNVMGKHIKKTDEFKCFKPSRIDSILSALSE